MKNKSLVTIIIISVAFLGIMLFSINKLTSKKNNIFYQSGYVSVSTALESKKIYFDNTSTYKKGYNNEIILNTPTASKVGVSKFSFVFYDDGSIGYLTNGVLLNLDEVQNEFVSYYNIKNNYIIQKENNLFKINSNKSPITFNNFLGKINNTKYIIAGNNIGLKLPTSEDVIKLPYIEVNFTDDEVVKIDSLGLSNETIADETYVYVGENIRIDLSKKAIYNENDELLASLKEIIIDNDENIDIDYEELIIEKPEEPAEPVTPPKDIHKVETVVEYKNVPYVELVDTNTNSHKIDIKFKVIDKDNLINGKIFVKCVNLSNGKTMQSEYAKADTIYSFIADSLSSEGKYLISISTSYTKNNQNYTDFIMFQRVFNTQSIGVGIEKDYVTEDELSYIVKIDPHAEFTSIEANLYDKDGKLVESKIVQNTGKDTEIKFNEKIKSNSQYTVKLENMKSGNILYSSGSLDSVSSTSLKHDPLKTSILSTPQAIVHKADYYFELNVGTIDDTNQSLKKITYNIIDNDTNATVKTITKDNISPVKLPVDNETILAKNTYHYNVIYTFNDGEKTIEYKSLDSNDFSLDRKSAPSIQFISNNVTSSTAEGYFIILDEEKAVDYTKPVYVTYQGSSGDYSTTPVQLEVTKCEENESEFAKCAKMSLKALHSLSTYYISLYAYTDYKDIELPAGDSQLGQVVIKTKDADTVYVDYNIHELDADRTLTELFNVDINLSTDLGKENIKEDIKSFTVSLYEGTDATGTFLAKYKTSINLVEEWFNNTKTLTLEDFNLTLDDIRRVHYNMGTPITNTFTLIFGDGYTKDRNVVFVENSITMDVNEIILGLNEREASFEYNLIYNLNTEENEQYYDKTLNLDTIIGIEAIPKFSNAEYAKYIEFTFRDLVTNEKITKNVDYEQIGEETPTYKFMFKDINKSSNFFVRGHSYKVEYKVALDINMDDKIEYFYPFDINDMSKSMPYVSEPIHIARQKPNMSLFPISSDSNSMTFKYTIDDLDHSLKEDYKVYFYETTEDVESRVYKEATFGSCLTSSGYKCFTISGLDHLKNYTIVLKPTMTDKYDGYNEAVISIDISTHTFETLIPENDSILTGVDYELERGENGANLYNNILGLKLNISEYLSKKVAYYKVELTKGNEKIILNNIIENGSNHNVIEYYLNNKLKESENAASEIVTIRNEDKLELLINYAYLYNSDIFKNYFETWAGSDISVNVYATYDTGKIGYDYCVTKNSDGTCRVTTEGKIYAMQVRDVTNEHDKEYVITTSAFARDTVLNPFAYGGSYYYTTNKNKAGFVDDNETLINEGTIYLLNRSNGFLSAGTETNVKYVVTSKGVKATLQDSYVIVAKELNTAQIVAKNETDKVFNYGFVAPAIGFEETSTKSTLNGLDASMYVSGINFSNIQNSSSNNATLTFEAFDGSTSIKSYNVDLKDQFYLSQQTKTVNNGKITLDKKDNYYLEINKVLDGTNEIQSFLYDYETATIDLKTSEFNGKNLVVTYRIIFTGLEQNKNYTMKVSTNIYDTITSTYKKVYLIDGTSPIKKDFEYSFSTLSSDVVGDNDTASLDILENNIYGKRTIILNYELDAIPPYESFEYELCAGDKCIKSAPLACETNYARKGTTESGTCINKKDNKLIATVNFDASITNDYDIPFGTDYNVKIYAKPYGNSQFEYITNSLHLRDLTAPVLEVDKDTYKYNGKYTLKFNVKVKDPDRVITNGIYVAYLTEGDSRIEVAGTRTIDNDATITKIFTFEDLHEDTAYRLNIDYQTYANNTEELIPEAVSIPYLIYTLNSNNISLGIREFIALNETSYLNFGYGSNLVEDLDPSSTQEAFVAGIIYTIRRISGNNTITKSDTIIFDGVNHYIEKKNDGSVNSAVGESYYQIALNDVTYPEIAGYQISYHFYLGGKITKDLNTRELCIPDESSSNKWDEDKNRCYILDDMEYFSTATYEGDK